MKFKKTLALIMGAALSVASLTGCSQATMNYADELAKTGKWEATSSEMTGKVSIDAQGVKEDINFTSTGYCSGNKGYAKVDFTTSNAQNIKIPSIEVYVDNETTYINKSYYEGIYTSVGMAVPDGLKALNADYIAVDSGIDVASLKSFTNEPEALNTIVKSIFGESDIDLPYTQNGREYTINLNSNDAVDLAVKGIKAAGNNIENINNTYKLGYTAEVLNQIKAAVNDPTFDQSVAGIKETVAGSTITSKEVFADDKYTMDFGVNLLIKNFGNLSLTLNGTSTKSEVKDITIPAKSVKVTQEQLQTMLGGTQDQVTQKTAYCKEQLKEAIANPAA